MASRTHPLAGSRAWARRRIRARPLLLSIGATVVVLSFCVSATIGLLADASLAGIRSTLRSASNGESSVVLRAPIARDSAAQDAGVRAVIGREFVGGPLVVSRTVTRSSDTVRWTITPSATKTTVDDLGRLAHGYASIEAAVTKSAAARSSAVELSGRGAATIASLVRSIEAQRAVEPIPITTLALAGIVALLLARNLLTESRQNETRLLRSRGGSRRTLTLRDAREAVVVSAIGTIIGSLAADAGLLSLYGALPSVVDVVAPPVLVFVASIAITVTAASFAARFASGAPRAGSGRRRATLSLTGVGFAILVAAIALWRFEQNGADGATFDSDPSAVLAPAAVLCVAVVLCLLVAGRVTAGLEVRRAARRSLAVFPIRSVNRHLAIVAGPTALLAIALALATVTGVYSGTWQRFATDSERLGTGGDLRVSLPIEPVLNDAGDLIPLIDFTGIRGIGRTAIAARATDTFGDEPVTVVALPSTALTGLIGSDSTVSDPSALARDLGTAAPAGLALPAGAASVTLSVVASARGANPATDSVLPTLWLGDSRGDLFPANLRPVPLTATAGSATTVAVTLPGSGGPWVIEAIDASVATTDTVSELRFRIAAVAAQVAGTDRPIAIPATPSWAPRNDVFEDGTNRASPAGSIGFDRAAVVGTASGTTSVRIMPAGSGAVPVVLSRQFASSAGLVPGSRMSVAGQWASFSAVVTGIVANVPGTASGDSMIANLPALDRGWLETSEQIPGADEVWMSSSASDAAAASIRRALPAAQIRLARDSGGDQIIRSATTVLWIGTVGTSAFAVIALVAAILALLRRRTVETRALRALGFDARRQSALRRGEVAIVASVAAASGAVTGIGVALLVTGTMARLSTPDAAAGLPLRLELDLVPIVVTVAVLGIALLCCALAYGDAVRRQARGGS